MGADPCRSSCPSCLNELDTVTTPIVLVLDDYHLVMSRAVQEQMTLLLSRMPANLHLVLATRSDPHFAIGPPEGCRRSDRDADRRFTIPER